LAVDGYNTIAFFIPARSAGEPFDTAHLVDKTGTP
jgi:hypothetical protein